MPTEVSISLSLTLDTAGSNALAEALARAIASSADSRNTILDQLKLMEMHMSAEMDDLKAQVTANTELLASATQLINGIADRMAAVAEDPAAIRALADELRTADAALADAVAANTPPPATP